MTEKQVQHAIKKVLQAFDFSVWDLSQPRATKQTPGLPDLIAVGHARVLFIEAKTAKGRVSDAQAMFGAEVAQNGGIWLVWRSAADAARYLIEQGIAKPAERGR